MDAFETWTDEAAKSNEVSVANLARARESMARVQAVLDLWRAVAR